MKAKLTIFSIWIQSFLVMAMIALLSGGVWFYHEQDQTIRKGIEEDLSSIASLKADQIVAWRKDHENDAALLQLHPFLLTSVLRFMAEASDENKRDLHLHLRNLADQHGYADMLLVTPEGEPKLRLLEPGETHRAYRPTLEEAIRDGKPVFTELHMENSGASPHISVIVPLYTAIGPEKKPFAALVLIIDASQFLYPLVQQWPTPSETAETLLVRRDGDNVLFLNELRHQSNTALQLRIPLSRTDVPAVMAVLGRQGVFQGKDYREVEVFSVILPIPDSPWFMIAKIDTAEAFAEWHYRAMLMLALFFGLTAFIGVTGLVLWQRDKKAHYRALYISEASLRANVERHSITLRSIGDAVISTDARGLVELVNPPAEALTGWNQDEARGRPLSEIFRIVSEKTREPSEDPVAKVLREGKVIGLANHTILVARDGTERPIADSGAPIRDDSGEIIGVVLVFRDQSAERQAQELLEKSEARYRQVLDSMLEGCQIIDFDWRYLYINDSAEKHNRRPKAQLLGQRYMDMWPGVEETEVFRRIRCCLNERVAVAIENMFVFPDGSSGWFDLRIEPVPEGLFILSIDITERKMAEQELQKSMERQRFLGDIIDNAQQPLAVGYPDGRIGVFNRAFCELTGYDLDELQAIDWNETLTPPEWRRIEAEVLANALDGTPVRYEKEYLRKDGTRVPIELLVHVINNEEGGIQCYHAFIVDISERKRAEAEHEKLQTQLTQAQKMEAVGRLAGGVAHDYNNMLSVIIGYSELAMDKVKAGDALRQDLKEIFDAANRSREITRQLLAFARKETIAPLVLDLNATVESMLNILRKLIGEDIDVVWHPGQMLEPVLLDPSQLDQILANLCVNARDAIVDVGTITIETRAVTIDADYCSEHAGFIQGDFVLLAVSDDGCGMDRETMNTIFEPFFTTKGSGKGTGLGLSTVYGIVKQNNGFINVYSEPGRGTTFKIYLPIHSGDISRKLRVRDEQVPDGNGETVLVVEDEISILKLADRILSRCNYKVLLAKSPSEALTVAHAHADEISLLITDVVMPGMNGRQLADHLKTICPGIKCLFMSGYTANVIAHRGVLDEGIQFIQKPFSANGLAAKAREVLDEQKEN